MISGRKMFFAFLLLLLPGILAESAGATTLIPSPAGQDSFPPYAAVASPFLSSIPSQNEPVAVGPVASGGNTLAVQIGLGQFSSPVDVYFAISAPAISSDLFMLTSSNQLLPYSAAGLVPWITNTSGNINAQPFGTVPVSAMAPGTYFLQLAVTPAGVQDAFYVWTTSVVIGVPAPQNENVVPVSVNGSLCSSNSYANKPCVSVTICSPGTSNCQVIDDILLDTGSYGLRIFRQVVNLSLPQETVTGGQLAECVQYASGASDWGPLQTADVILGNEPPVRTPIQVIDSAFGSRPSACADPDISPVQAGFNGILGVGFFAQDCGSWCASHPNNGMYYVCNGSGCVGAAAPVSSQVQNPVTLLPQDNNGVIVQLPAVPGGVSASTQGSLVLGIGTRSNNIPSAVAKFQANQLGNFVTVFNGISYDSFIDSGSNGLFFPGAPNLPACPAPFNEWFCPPTVTDLSATNIGAASETGVVPFQITNFDSFAASGNFVSAEIGGPFPNSFDWGLPFFFGRNVFVGFEGGASSLGSGPYWAY